MSELPDVHEAVAHLPRLLTPREAAEVLRRTPRTLRRWERQGLIRAVRPAGGDPVYERAEIARLIREGRQ
jgi:excisionase family DNA binding protein